MSPAERRVILLSGHATFDVAKDPARPFVVQSGAVRAQALGTVFTVRRLGDEGGLIEVTEGQVKVWSVRGEARSVVIHAGESLKLEPDAERRDAKTRQAPRQMSIDDDTVGAIAGRMNAVNRTKIVIENPETEKMKIVGLFSETEPARFAEAVSAISGDAITYDNGTIVIKRRN
jgi:transmembrane sensor